MNQIKCPRCGKLNSDSAELAEDMGIPRSISNVDRLCMVCFEDLQDRVDVPRSTLKSMAAALRKASSLCTEEDQPFVASQICNMAANALESMLEMKGDDEPDSRKGS